MSNYLFNFNYYYYYFYICNNFVKRNYFRRNVVAGEDRLEYGTWVSLLCIEAIPYVVFLFNFFPHMYLSPKISKLVFAIYVGTCIAVNHFFFYRNSRWKEICAYYDSLGLEDGEKRIRTYMTFFALFILLVVIIILGKYFHATHTSEYLLRGFDYINNPKL
jgi:hypothetical protein